MSSDATAVPKQKQPAGKSKGWTKAAIIWSGMGLLFASGMMLFVLWIVGITHGREFDVVNWSFRSFTFVRNPLTGKQFSSIKRSSDFTVPANIIPLASGGPLAPSSRWDLVEIYKGPSHSVGEAQILLNYLSALNQQNDYFWDVWTTKNPKAAPILWSAVRDCVHLPRYDRLPEIFEIGRSITEPAQLKSKLNQIMLDIARDEAKLQSELGNTEAKLRAEKLVEVYLNSAGAKPQAEVEQIP